jgi:hypothetical protein
VDKTIRGFQKLRLLHGITLSSAWVVCEGGQVPEDYHVIHPFPRML